MMKKLINDPRNVVQELIDGFVPANEHRVRRHPKVNVVIRSDAPVPGKVGIVMGGGAGHEPLFLEYVLLLYNNYAGDVLNFDMAQEKTLGEGISVRTVLINDEIASAPKGQEAQRRGTTADHIVIKMAGAAAEKMLPMEEVARITKKAVAGSRSLGVAPSSLHTAGDGKRDLRPA